MKHTEFSPPCYWFARSHVTFGSANTLFTFIIQFGDVWLACWRVVWGRAGAPGVLASPFAAMHGLGSPLTSPYGNSAVGGMGGTHYNTLFCSLFFSSLQSLPPCALILFDAWTCIYWVLCSLPWFSFIYYSFVTRISCIEIIASVVMGMCQNCNMWMLKKNT